MYIYIYVINKIQQVNLTIKKTNKINKNKLYKLLFFINLYILFI